MIPVFNEEENIPPLVNGVRTAMPAGERWELLLVDDGSRDDTARIAESIAGGDERVRVLRLARNYGQTQAMQAGFDHARGEVVVSMDGDLQNDPLDIPLLVAKLEEGYDLVAGYRLRRRDRLVTRKVPSWVANRLIARITGVRIRDNGCSLKAYRRELLNELHLYSDMHRFLPALAAATAGARITEIPVRHHPRRFGVSKYGLSRVAKLLADLLTIKMITSFRERPLAMLAAGAVASFFFGVLFLIASVFALAQAPGRWSLANADAYVLPSCAILFVALSCYLLMLGLIAEEALRVAREDGSYLASLPDAAT